MGVSGPIDTSQHIDLSLPTQISLQDLPFSQRSLSKGWSGACLSFTGLADGMRRWEEEKSLEINWFFPSSDMDQSSFSSCLGANRNKWPILLFSWGLMQVSPPIQEIFFLSLTPPSCSNTCNILKINVFIPVFSQASPEFSSWDKLTDLRSQHTKLLVRNNEPGRFL